MNTIQRWTVVIITAVVIGIALFAGSSALARTNGSVPFGSGYNMMGGYAPNQTGAAQMQYANMMGYNQTYTGTVPYGMMNGNGMMGNSQSYSGTVPYGMMNGNGVMNGGMMGNGMMNGNMMGMMGNSQTYSGTIPYGMMGGFGSNNRTGAKPLSIDQAKTAIEKYLTGLNNSDLSLKEIIIFDNQAYGRIVEKSTGLGAFEVLVDPVTLAVYPEYGPNMMWNLKYGMMSNAGGMLSGGMMGSRQSAPQANGPMTVSAAQAVQAAQRYLDTYLPGARAATDPDQFYGYYTIEILRNDKPSGMLSVNGYTQQVFLHTWHGNFVELSEN
jgi:hypothetical protein